LCLSRSVSAPPNKTACAGGVERQQVSEDFCRQISAASSSADLQQNFTQRLGSGAAGSWSRVDSSS
jgi:hypothetical protein